MLIKRFGERHRKTESEPANQWYELASGERVTCDELTIELLWSHWVLNPEYLSYRDDSDTDVIFAYYQPQEINLAEIDNIQKHSYEIQELA